MTGRPGTERTGRLASGADLSDVGKRRRTMVDTPSPPAGGTSELTEEKAEPGEPHAAAAALLKGCPAAALLARADGSVIAANDKAAGVEALLQNGAVPEIGALIKKAADEGSVFAGIVPLAGAKGEIVLEITVVPQVGMAAYLVLARDLTMERNLRSTLVESRQRYKDLVEVSSDFAWEVDATGTFAFVSPRGALGFEAGQLVGSRPEEFVINPEDYKPLPFLSDRPIEDVEMWMRRADGSTACVMASCLPLKSRDGIWQGARGICRDVTEERRREAALSRSSHREQLLNYIVGTIRDEVEPGNMLAAAATATAQVLAAGGCRIFRLDETGIFKVAAETGATDGVGALMDLLSGLESGGKPVAINMEPWRVLVIATQYRQSVNGAISIWKRSDEGDWSEDDRILISHVASQIGIANEQITNHERIVKLSRTDDLTGLLNRRAFFEEELPRRLKRLQRANEPAALFYLDLDNFKWVNDVHGHQHGDEALLFLRDVLTEHSRPGDVIARIGGDEFALWLDRIDEAAVAQRVQDLIESCRRLRRFSGSADRPLSVSVGVAMYDPRRNEDLDDLLARADAAMYDAKHAGKGRYKVGASAGPSDDDVAGVDAGRPEDAS